MRRSMMISAMLGLVLTAASTASAQAASAQAEIVWKSIPGPGKKCVVSDEYYFNYAFDKKPQMGMAILKVQVFDKKGTKVTPFEITGRSDMPSMRGAHDSGELAFKTNKVNNYLLPVNIVMPGDWEIRVTFLLNNKPVFHGSIRFNV
jgi:hypothetical protein